MFQAICSDDRIEGHIYRSHGSAWYEVAAKDVGSKTWTLTIDYPQQQIMGNFLGI